MDHKSLLKIFSDWSLKEISNGRVCNLKEKTLQYRFQMVHISGVHHKVLDAVSHHPTGSTNPDLLPLPDDIAAVKNPTSFFPFDPTMHPFLAGICCEELPQESCSHKIDDKLTSSAVSALSTMAITWDRVKLAITSDKDLIQLVSIIESGLPESHHKIPPALHEYYQFCKHLYTVDGVILYKDHIIIPPSLYQHIVAILHSAHQGITSITAHVESSVFLARHYPCHHSAMSKLQSL